VLLVVLLAIGGGVAAFLLVRDDNSKAGGTSGATAPSAKAATITAATPFDPLGDGVEDNADAPSVLDGDPSSVWSTDQYNQWPDGQKDGVGLALSLDGEFDVRKVTVDTQQSGWAASIYVSDQEVSTLTSPSASLADWGPVRAQGEGLSTSHTFDTGGVKGQSVLVWLTQLPSGQTNSGETKHFVDVTEVKVA
jgi:hypothetical protein